MALDPIEWIVIGVIVIVVVMWGPGKIPEFAKALASARKELDLAKKEIGNPSEALLRVASQTAPEPAQGSSDDVFVATARKMGITTEGKTREQIANEMVGKTAPKTQEVKTA